MTNTNGHNNGYGLLDLKLNQIAATFREYIMNSDCLELEAAKEDIASKYRQIGVMLEPNGVYVDYRKIVPNEEGIGVIGQLEASELVRRISQLNRIIRLYYLSQRLDKIKARLSQFAQSKQALLGSYEQSQLAYPLRSG